MRTNKQFIPVDSSFELQVAEKLIDEYRAFAKPLKLGDDPYLPDFVLNDCRGKWVLEVFGVTGDEKYHTRKLEKIQYYHDKHMRCWQWSPGSDSGIPPFPSK
jgi:predicted nuclease of restriction endonuclease-like RecB superfamily